MNTEFVSADGLLLKSTVPVWRMDEPPRVTVLSWKDFFGNANSVEVEIGCGKGKFLTACAAQRPDRNFIGLDIAGKWMKVGALRSVKRKLGNLRFVKENIHVFILRIPPASVSIFHIYFPDPWPKRRHRRRRVISVEFLQLLLARLAPEGLIEIATDDPDYFSVIKAAAWNLRPDGAGIDESISRRLLRPDNKTNYELKFEAMNKPLYYIEIAK